MVATKRRFNPNLQKVRIDVGGTPRREYVCTRCLKAGKVPSTCSRRRRLYNVPVPDESLVRFRRVVDVRARRSSRTAGRRSTT